MLVCDYTLHYTIHLSIDCPCVLMLNRIEILIMSGVTSKENFNKENFALESNSKEFPIYLVIHMYILKICHQNGEFFFISWHLPGNLPN